WFGDHPAQANASGVLSVYINSALPQPLKIPAVIAGQRTVDGARATQFRFVGLSDAVVDMLEKLIFRHHRRLVAGAKQATS
ncbi:MAG TPA: PilZ domain-containing protein, partial [Steroidobacteraceae bacterium]|nr:PilZ domain-containing protein [Steroidobacteraceae bacterium]